MNLLLVEREWLNEAGDRATIRGPAAAHLERVLRKSVGDSVRAGLIDGPLGTARIERIQDQGVELALQLDHDPPSPIPLVVVLALPRPKVLRRVLRGLANLGVEAAHVVHSLRVEKSYWQSPLLRPAPIRESLLEGLSLAGDTRLPEVSFHRFFRPFVEDRLPTIAAGRDLYVAQPRADELLPSANQTASCVVLGPEGGFVPFEVELLRAQGARAVSLGSRVLGVETAVPALVGRWRERGSDAWLSLRARGRGRPRDLARCDGRRCRGSRHRGAGGLGRGLGSALGGAGGSAAQVRAERGSHALAAGDWIQRARGCGPSPRSRSVARLPALPPVVVDSRGGGADDGVCGGVSRTRSGLGRRGRSSPRSRLRCSRFGARVVRRIRAVRAGHEGLHRPDVRHRDRLRGHGATGYRRTPDRAGAARSCV